MEPDLSIMIRPRCVLLDKECIDIGRDRVYTPEYRKKHKISGQLPDPIYYHLFTVK